MLFSRINNNLSFFEDKIAFVIENKSFSYLKLKKRICAIYDYLEKQQVKAGDYVVVYVEDSIDTYASILAIFMTGAIFVPINNSHPIERNRLIIKQLQNPLFLCTKKNIERAKNTTELRDILYEIDLRYSMSDIAYILFTSGSTGTPKGVKISYKNISRFIIDFSSELKNLTSDDKFLQIYDLTFDASLKCFLLPLFTGCSIYTVPHTGVKFLEALKLIIQHTLTVVKFPPSLLAYAQTYLKKTVLPDVKYSFLGGEAIHKKLVEFWQKVVCNAEICIVYGPTEATVNTHIYKISGEELSTYKDVLSIGKTFGSNRAIIIDGNDKQLNNNKIGELCLSGDQICSGYLNNEHKNNTQFFYKKIGHKKVKFYKSGDLVFLDDENNYMFVGRKDKQVQIQGFRVELQEIENAVKNFGNMQNCAVCANKNKYETTELFLFVQNLLTDTSELLSFLATKLPPYMLPDNIINVDIFPETTTGKIDKIKLLEQYIKQ